MLKKWFRKKEELQPGLYIELIDYIFIYHSEFFNEKEKKANTHYIASRKFEKLLKTDSPRADDIRNRLLTDDKEALELLKGGRKQFIINTATRIYNEHKHEMEFNLCPKCNKITRTPLAQQCRFCFHNWH